MSGEDELRGFQHLHHLKAGEEGRLGPFGVWRVPGGWIFHTNREASEVFVPFNNEFQAATPPGTEVVPEGTMAALEALNGSMHGIKNITTNVFDANDYKALKQSDAILTRHRATKETPNAQG